MKVLVVGSGGREHAIAWHLRRSGATVVVAPGNAGTGALNAPVQALDIDGLVDLAKNERVDLTVVGPEAPLAAGLVDRFAVEKLTVFGPTRAAARLEWSKAWTKDFLGRHGIPTAAVETVGSREEAHHAIERRGLPLVLKADGLAAGKGVFVVSTPAELDSALHMLFDGLGEKTILVEECLEGPELSVLAFSDGQTLRVMPPARDYKRLLDGDHGPNTGGMGGYTRPSDATQELLADVEQRILRPTLEGMQREGHLYQGVLYAGLMLTRDGPKVLEFNCRFGDPECELILPLLETNLAEICLAAASGELGHVGVDWRDDRTYGVVLAARGYPDAPRTGDTITGLDGIPARVFGFHAGTRLADDSRLVTAGGRVLTLVGEDWHMVYRGARAVHFDGKQFRGDIGVEIPEGIGASR
ncbi:MAG: phosphoribosylamine--glycine ligase [Chloroflexi bacterium]|nr:phosphoribosylamine--glycine ligase [Chloroflexota bacterium]